MAGMLIPLDVAHHSGMISPTHSGMMSPGVTRPLLAPIRSRLSALRRGTWMPTERFAMRHVRDVIKLKSAEMPTREIARRMERPVDSAVDDPPVRSGGAELAFVRRHHRH